MIDIFLYTPVTLGTINNPTTISLFLSANNADIDRVETLFQQGTGNPFIGTRDYNTKYFPALSSSLILEAEYILDTTTLETTAFYLSGDTYEVYNGENRVLLTSNLSVTNSPVAYFTPETGDITFIETSNDYDPIFSFGIAKLQTISYNVPGFFDSRFGPDYIIIDWGDGTIEPEQYSGQELSFLYHTYVEEGTYTISITAATLFPVVSNPIVKVFPEAITILKEQKHVEKSIARINSQTPTILPNRTTKIPVNEWVDATPLNTILKELYDNIDYLKDISSIYKLAPLKREGQATFNEDKLMWYTDSMRTGIVPEKSSTTINDICCYFGPEANSFIHSTDKVFYEHSYLFANETYNALSVPIRGFESAKNIKAIDIAFNGNVYILDDRKLKINVYSLDEISNTYIPIFDWGGLGGVTGKGKFYKPNDLKIYKDNVFVADSGNKCIKEFTLAGQWVRTFTSTYFDEEEPLSVCADDNNVYAVTENQIVRFNRDGAEIYGKNIQMLSSPALQVEQMNGFVYVLTRDNVIRIFPTGETTNIFAMRNDGNPYKVIFADTHNNLYIANEEFIYKFTDTPILLESTRDTGKYWAFDDIKIKSEDFVTSSVYNRAFHRLYDNLHSFFHTIEYKVITKQDFTLEKVPLEKCDVGVWNGLPIDKDEIYIGLNEFVTPEVINRCIQQILIIQQYVLDILMNEYSGCNTGNQASFKIDLPVIPECCWSWRARKTDLCCITWKRLTESSPCTLWSQATTCCVQTFV